SGIPASGRNAEGTDVLILCAQPLSPAIATPPRKLRRFIRYLVKTVALKDSARRGAGLGTRGGNKSIPKGRENATKRAKATDDTVNRGSYYHSCRCRVRCIHERHQECSPDILEVTRLHSRSTADVSAQHRCKYRGVQRHRRGFAAAVAV